MLNARNRETHNNKQMQNCVLGDVHLFCMCVHTFIQVASCFNLLLFVFVFLNSCPGLWFSEPQIKREQKNEPTSFFSKMAPQPGIYTEGPMVGGRGVVHRKNQ